MALILLGAFAFVAAAIELILVLRGPVEPVVTGAIFPLAASVYVGAGLLVWARRPANRMGPLLVAGGLSLLLGGLVGANEPALIAAGQVTATICLAVVVHLLLGFPSGRVRGRLPQLLVAAGYFISLVVQAPLYLFAPGPEGPSTALRITPDATVVDRVLDVQHVIGICVMAGVIAVLVGRLRAASGRQRRVLAPVYLYGVVVALGIPLSANLLRGSPTLEIVQVTVLGLLPVAFLLGIRLGGFSPTAELEELGAWLGSGDRGVVDALAAALGDDSVELAYWSATARRFVDADGRPVDLPALGSGRAAVEVDVAGRRVGAIVYDANLIAEPETVRAAARVVGLALDHERMRHEIVVAADSERRRIAQDLHDGLQSRLVVLAAHADLDGHTALRDGLRTAIDELRDLVQDTMPAILVERGLFRATEDLAASLPLPVTLELRGDAEELSGPVQSSVYFVIAEALTNAIKHSQARELAVRLERVGDRLEVEVRDDGVGGTRFGAGAGVQGMTERVAQLGGRVTVHSPRGAGTRIFAEVPCA